MASPSTFTTNSTLPTPLYGLIKHHQNNLNFAYLNSESVIQKKMDSQKELFTFIHQLSRQHKIIAIGFEDQQLFEEVKSRLWLKKDVVPILLKTKTSSLKQQLKNVRELFDDNNIAQVQINSNNRVKVLSLVSLNDIRRTCTPEELSELETLAKNFHGKTITFINSTPQGGGVSIMRHALMRLLELLGVDARWYVLSPDEEVFKITKQKMHNVLQGVAPQSTRLTADDQKKYTRWIEQNAKKFQPVFRDSDVIIIDDPQPSGLIPFIQKANPQTKIFYRSHIQIDTQKMKQQNSPQLQVWSFIWNNIKTADAFIFHPVVEFVPPNVPQKKIVYMPPTIDPLDGLSKPLTPDQRKYYRQLFNSFLQKIEKQTPLDFSRPYIVQIARFDPSKGIPDVLESYYRLCQRLTKEHKPCPQLVIAGNRSVDDPDITRIFAETIEIIETKKFIELKKDIKVVHLPHIDQMLNTLLHESTTALQLSYKEGFEFKVTEALMKGKPVIVYNSGGIPLQVKDGVNGFVVDTHHVQTVTDHLYDLLTNEQLYRTMSDAATQYYDKSLTTVRNALRWLTLSDEVLKT